MDLKGYFIVPEFGGFAALPLSTMWFMQGFVNNLFVVNVRFCVQERVAIVYDNGN